MTVLVDVAVFIERNEEQNGVALLTSNTVTTETTLEH